MCEVAKNTSGRVIWEKAFGYKINWKGKHLPISIEGLTYLKSMPSLKKIDEHCYQVSKLETPIGEKYKDVPISQEHGGIQKDVKKLW